MKDKVTSRQPPIRIETVADLKVIVDACKASDSVRIAYFVNEHVATGEPALGVITSGEDTTLLLGTSVHAVQKGLDDLKSRMEYSAIVKWGEELLSAMPDEHLTAIKAALGID